MNSAVKVLQGLSCEIGFASLSLKPRERHSTITEEAVPCIQASVTHPYHLPLTLQAVHCINSL